MREAFPGEERAIGRFFAFIDELSGAVEAAAKARSGLIARLKFAAKIPKLLRYMRHTLADEIDPLTNDASLKALFGAFSGEVGLPPDRVSAFGALTFAHYIDGAYYPHGGSGALRDALVHEIEAHGGVLENNAKVETRRLDDRVFSQKELSAWRANVTLLLQDAPCLSGTILKNLSFPFAFKNASGKKFDQRAAEDLMKQTGLSHIPLTSDISRLSGGERHRLNLVRGLLWAPPVLLVDESLSGLEPELADNCFSLLKRYSRKRPAIVICVLHEERLSLQADSWFKLENGTLHRIRSS